MYAEDPLSSISGGLDGDFDEMFDGWWIEGWFPFQAHGEGAGTEVWAKRGEREADDGDAYCNAWI